MAIPGTIPVTGPLAPTDASDNYPVTDARYGIDGLRNVDTFADRNAIPELRRRSGMLVGVAEDSDNIYKLLPAPWNYDDTDWELFIPGDGINSLVGIDVLKDDVPILQNVSQLNFIGTGVTIQTASPANGQVDVIIQPTYGHKKYIASTETITVLPDYQYWIYGDFEVDGTVDNYGEVVIANGTLVLGTGGSFNNLGAGLLKIVNLATGDSMQVVIKTFTTVADTPLNIVHNLGTKDFTFNVREGDTAIDIEYSHIDDNTIEILTTTAITNGTIVFHAKI